MRTQTYELYSFIFNFNLIDTYLSNIHCANLLSKSYHFFITISKLLCNISMINYVKYHIISSIMQILQIPDICTKYHNTIGIKITKDDGGTVVSVSV